MINVLLYPVLEFHVLRLQMTEEQIERFNGLSPEEKVEFIKMNLNEEERDQIADEYFLDMYKSGLSRFELQKGICRKCGSTLEDPSTHPEYGPSFWVDESESLCSHCDSPITANDPRTVKPKGVRVAVFPKK